MIVTIQRELGAGGLSVGEALAADLGATLLSERTIIDSLCARGGFSAAYLQRVDERPPSAASTFMADLARATAMVQAMEWRSTEHAVVDQIRSLVLEAAERGHVVVVGHGGSQLLAGAVDQHQIFSILLHAGREWRIAQVQKRWSLTHEEATERVRRTDDLRRKYVQHFFSTDLYDARAYDIVIDTERLGIETAIELSRTALRTAMRVPV